MENKEMLELILSELKDMKGDIKELKQGQKDIVKRLDSLEMDTDQLKKGQKVILETMNYQDIEKKHLLKDIADNFETNRKEHISMTLRLEHLESKI